MFEPVYCSFKVLDINAISIYIYNDIIRTYLYQFKGCFDIELADAFLQPFYRELSFMYSGFTIVPVPSYKKEDEKRGFNHVVEIFSRLKLPIEDVLIKTARFKQANNKKNERKDISKFLTVKGTDSLRGKRVLIVDDVYTTGSTMKAAIQLVKSLGPKEIRVLVMSKTEYKS